MGGWRANAEHRIAQATGRRDWYTHYETRIAKVERAYGKPPATPRHATRPPPPHLHPPRPPPAPPPPRPFPIPPPAASAETRPEVLHDFIDRHPLGLLVAPTPGGL